MPPSCVATIDAIVDHRGRFDDRLAGRESPQGVAVLFLNGVQESVARRGDDHAGVAEQFWIGRQIGGPSDDRGACLEAILDAQRVLVFMADAAEVQVSAVGRPDHVLAADVVPRHQRLHQRPAKRLAKHRGNLLAEVDRIGRNRFGFSVLLGRDRRERSCPSPFRAIRCDRRRSSPVTLGT